MRAISYSEMRNNLATVLDNVVDDSDATIITRRGDQHGDRAVVLMPLTEYNSWMETVHLLRGRNHARLMRAIEQDQSGHAVKRDLLDA
ncbi:MAG: type II toxin-antitoxin system prevent-host-death family antitoxin [Rhodanobacter sp.]